MTFWLRRWIEQSRTPSAHAVPCPSAMTCTSTCRAPVTSRSRNTTPLPNARGRLVAGALVGVGQLVVGGDHPDAAAAAAGGRLEHQRVADLWLPRPARPRGCRRRPGSTGRPARRPPRRCSLEPILSPSLRIASALRADEGDADPVAQLGEGRVLGDEPPADPGGVGAGLAQGALEDRVVEVGARGRRAERVGEVGLAHEHRGALAVGVQGDGLDRAAPPSALSSRTAWMSRMAASPRLTMAIRLNTDCASCDHACCTSEPPEPRLPPPPLQGGALLASIPATRPPRLSRRAPPASAPPPAG